MQTVRYEIRFNGLTTPDGTIRWKVFHGIAQTIIEGAERTLRLATEGRSVKRGKQPDYIEESVDFVISGLSTGSTIMYLDAPTLAETAFTHIQQLDFWGRAPKPQDTAISLLCEGFQDAVAEKYDSDHYDAGVLSTFTSTKSFFDGGLESVEIRSKDRQKEHLKLNCSIAEQFEKIKKITPEPQKVIISGKLDQIEHSTRSYKLRLQNGLVLQGSTDESLIDAEQLRAFWGKDVTLKGTLFFRPSSVPRYIEADHIRAYAEQDSLFATLPGKESVPEIVSELRRKYKGASVLNEIWGEWPGDESIDELLAILQKK